MSSDEAIISILENMASQIAELREAINRKRTHHNDASEASEGPSCKRTCTREEKEENTEVVTKEKEEEEEKRGAKRKFSDPSEDEPNNKRQRCDEESALGHLCETYGRPVDAPELPEGAFDRFIDDHVERASRDDKNEAFDVAMAAVRRYANLHPNIAAVVSSCCNDDGASFMPDAHMFVTSQAAAIAAGYTAREAKAMAAQSWLKAMVSWGRKDKLEGRLGEELRANLPSEENRMRLLLDSNGFCEGGICRDALGCNCPHSEGAQINFFWVPSPRTFDLGKDNIAKIGESFSRASEFAFEAEFGKTNKEGQWVETVKTESCDPIDEANGVGMIGGLDEDEDEIDYSICNDGKILPFIIAEC